VWYQIFPERFRNGDPNNDPQFRDTFGSWPHDTVSAWEKSQWTADWYRLQPWEAANGKSFNYNAGRRRFGGDLQGVIDKLDYLQALGVNALYLNPVFESPTLHKYDTELYHHIDNNFGPNPARDREIWATENFSDPSTWKWTTADSLFLKLIREAHSRNMRLIIDGVFNHMGVTNPAFQHVRKHGKASPFADWFFVTSWDDPTTPQNEFDYRAWDSGKTLPEIKEEGDDLAPGPKQFIHAVVKRWMDPNSDGDPSDGIDGWRLDTAELLPKGFWRQFRQWVREINPHAYITGEYWWEDFLNNKMFNAAPVLQGDMFDAVMNYRFADGVLKFFVDTQNAYTPQQFAAHLQQIYDEYPRENNFVLMNLMDSHDTERLGSMVVNPNRMIDHASTAERDTSFSVRKPNAEEMKTARLIAAFQAFYLGAPMIYYGAEAGMWGADDPDERKPMVWPDLVYETERSHPTGRARPADSVYFDQELYQHYQTVLKLRREQVALRRGACSFVELNDAPNVIAFERSEGAERLLCLFNRSAQTERITLPEGYSNLEILFGEAMSGAPRVYELHGKSALVLRVL
jgi:glycosidase